MSAFSIPFSDGNNAPLPIPMRQRDFKALTDMFDGVEADQMRSIETLLSRCAASPLESVEEVGTVVIDPNDYTLEINS